MSTHSFEWDKFHPLTQIFGPLKKENLVMFPLWFLLNSLWLETILLWWSSLINAFTTTLNRGLTGVLVGDGDFQGKNLMSRVLWKTPNHYITLKCLVQIIKHNHLLLTPHTVVKIVHTGSFLHMISATSLLVNDPKCLCKYREGHLTMFFCSNSL